MLGWLTAISVVILVLGVPWISHSMVFNLVWEISLTVLAAVLLVAYIRNAGGRRAGRRHRSD